MGTIGCKKQNLVSDLRLPLHSLLGLVQVILWDKCLLQCGCQCLFVRTTVLFLV